MQSGGIVPERTLQARAWCDWCCRGGVLFCLDRNNLSKIGKAVWQLRSRPSWGPMGALGFSAGRMGRTPYPHVVLSSSLSSLPALASSQPSSPSTYHTPSHTLSRHQHHSHRPRDLKTCQLIGFVCAGNLMRMAMRNDERRCFRQLRRLGAQ